MVRAIRALERIRDATGGNGIPFANKWARGVAEEALKEQEQRTSNPLVAWLRETAAMGLGYSPMRMRCTEAADEIERLMAENKILRGERDTIEADWYDDSVAVRLRRCTEAYTKMWKERDRLRAALVKIRDDYGGEGDHRAPLWAAEALAGAAVSHVVDEKAGDSPQRDTDETEHFLPLSAPELCKDRLADETSPALSEILAVQRIANEMMRGECQHDWHPRGEPGRIQTCAKCLTQRLPENGEGGL